ncbi:1-acyl-sn-glycerol-3-phosphate acyltransferase [Spirillospora sp. NPDC050679]
MIPWRSRRGLAAEILRDPAALRQIRALADRTGAAPDKTGERVALHLRGLVAEQGAFSSWLLRAVAVAVYGRPEVTPATRAELIRLRRSGVRPLVFLPAHRSYADSLLLSVALHDAGLPATYRLAGENLAFWPLSSIARRSGVVFIRRDFGNDRAYQLAVRLYLAHLLRQGAHLEWYAEGGRTRTGRLRRPRLGFLRELLAALDQGDGACARIVPLAFTYRLLPEAGALVDEDGGATKPAEGPRLLLRRLAADRRARVRPARLGLGALHSPCDETAPSADPGRWAAARALGARLTYEWNLATPLTGEALVCLALAAGHRRPRGLEALLRELRSLVEYAARRSIPVIDGEAVTAAAPLRALLDDLCRAGVLTGTQHDSAPRYWIGRDQQHLAAYHRHAGGHHFIDRCVAELGVLAADDDPSGFPLRMHALLGHAFALPPRSEFLDLVAGAASTLGAPVPVEDGPRLLARQPFLLAHRLLGAPLEAHLDVALCSRPPDPRTGPPRPAPCRPRRWPESRSRALHAAGLAAATEAGRWADGPTPPCRPRPFLDELRHLVDRLADIASLDDRIDPTLPEER